MDEDIECVLIDECEPLREKRTTKGRTKYPFDSLAVPGNALDIRNRAESTIRQALKRWVKTKASEWKFTVRDIGTGVVRVRRDR